jgi:hypothetical protein
VFTSWPDGKEKERRKKEGVVSQSPPKASHQPCLLKVPPPPHSTQLSIKTSTYGVWGTFQIQTIADRVVRKSPTDKTKL